MDKVLAMFARVFINTMQFLAADINMPVEIRKIIEDV